MKKYTYDEVLEASVKYFNGDELAAKVFTDKYALQNTNGEYLELTPTDMHHRLAKEFARIEQKYPNPMSEEEIFGLLDGFKYIVPQGSPMSAIGNPYQIQSLSNCFVIQGVHSSKLDSYGGIMLADQELAQIFKRRGGCGLDISGIRPKGAITHNAAKTTDGIAVFMERFSNTSREVAINGRRAAEMITISVNHPEIETFIYIKRNLTKITGANISIKMNEEFMEAVKKDKPYTLRWPVDVPVKDAKVTKEVSAKEIWDKIIESAWSTAEPGVLFWDTIRKNTPSDIYASQGHESISTNPCFSGDTLIAVADGRNAVSIKTLADEGKDVPVYSVNKETGKVSIKWARHPRITGYDKTLVRIKLDDGSFFDVTPSHRCLLKDGKEILAKDLQYGDGLPRFSKTLQKVSAKNKKPYYMIDCDTQNYQTDKTFEHRLIAKFYFQKEWDHIYDKAKETGFVKTGGLVVHHKDFNQLNNSPDNLQVMTFTDHCKLHAEIDTIGENNGKYSGFTADNIKLAALDLTKSLGRRFSRQDWIDFASKRGMPQAFSSFRKEQFGSVLELAKLCASELGFEYVNENPKLVKIYHNMLKQGYDAKIENGEVLVKRKCESCHCFFETVYSLREQSFCSIDCIGRYLNIKSKIKSKQNASILLFNKNKMQKIRQEQARIYSQLKFELKRDPMMKEWEVACKKNGLSSRIGKSLKFGYKNFKEVAEAGDNYNHKVVSVEELPGKHTVYNITVDENHTLAVITKFDKNDVGQGKQSGVYVAQCGEIVLPKYDACRLLVLNLNSYVKNAFSKNASFDFDLFNSHAIKAQRLMDDVVDLEIEQVEKILTKVESDPEPSEVKQVELNLWTKILNANKSGRRTGLGITALGDCLAGLNIKYGSKESIEKTRKIYKSLAVSAHTSSCIMAKERGAFPIFDYNKEKDHKYLNFIFNSCSDLVKQMWAETGRRNIALTTTAPTGTVSILTQTTSGIEPVYLLSYVRRKKINPSDKGVRVDFTDALGDKWQEFTVYHHGIKRWMDITGETDVKKSPYYGATSNDIDWMASVDIQAVAQASVDHCLSKTCNLPNSATKELVSEVYMRAYDSGCKGFTVYRDGCRSGVLVSEETHKKQNATSSSGERPPEIESASAPKRLHTLPCDIKKVKVQGEAWTIFVGLLNGVPYEVFGGLSKYVDIPNKHKAGKIVKNGKVDGVSTYNLAIGEGDDEMVIKDISNVFENANYGAFTRTISLSLRHGVPIQFIVEQLQKDKNSEITSFSKVMSRVLKSYIKDGVKSSAEKICPSCKQENTLVYQEGCVKCVNPACGFSKCN